MDAHLFRLFCQSAAPALAGARIEKIQEPARDHICITFYGGGGKRRLCLRFGRKEPFCFITAQNIAALPRPSAAIMRLRKYCQGRRILTVTPDVWARKLWLLTGGEAEKAVWLCLDLVNGANLHFLEAEEAPMALEPVWPQTTELDAALADWRGWPVLTPPLRRTLARLERGEQLALLADLESGSGDVFLYRDQNNAIVRACAWPLADDSQLKEECREDVQNALEQAGLDLVLAAIHAEKEKAAQNAETRRERQLRKTLEKMDADAARLRAMAAREADAKALAANLWRWNKAEKLTQVEIPAENGQEARTIILPRPQLALVDNMAKLFHDARRGKRGLVLLEQRRVELLARAPAAPGPGEEEQGTGTALAAPQKRLPPNLPRHVQAFWSTDGYLILRGRNAKGNLALRRAASGHDIWAHVETGPGAHVILRRPHGGHEPPARALMEAGSLAANKSWLCEAATAAVMYAEMRHVKISRTGPEGKVTIDKLLATRIVPVDPGLENRLACPEPADKAKR